ncbi:hypothetical protein K474DRAFT_1670386 [Panus rudis PR-1116 ss-1]|nr:hypothetical protein K474DRAFT_1670386 [Panus rudis PR-1116 ss-1]
MKFSVSVTLAALLGVVAADLKVTNPSSSSWWVANSINTIAWTCKESSFQTFTIFIANSDPKVLTSPQAIIAVQNNFDCSKTITQDQANYTAGTGYSIQLANPLNSSDIYAQSDLFEIKPLGSAYPATSSAAPSPTDSSSGSSPSSSDAPTGASGGSSGATSLSMSVSALAAAGVAALGFVLA